MSDVNISASVMGMLAAAVLAGAPVRADAGKEATPPEVGNSTSFSVPAGDPPLARISMPGVDGVVVPPDLARQLLGTNHGKWTFWLPSTATIEKFEAQLPVFLKKDPPKPRRKLWAELDRYKRQYVGLEDRKHRHLLVTHLHCSVLDDWTNRFFVVTDGGPCHVQVWFDTTKNRILYVFVSGRA